MAWATPLRATRRPSPTGHAPGLPPCPQDLTAAYFSRLAAARQPVLWQRAGAVVAGRGSASADP
jgi:hypothetical protein